jgi:hypothetical protein
MIFSFFISPHLLLTIYNYNYKYILFLFSFHLGID